MADTKTQEYIKFAVITTISFVVTLLSVIFSGYLKRDVKIVVYVFLIFALLLFYTCIFFRKDRVVRLVMSLMVILMFFGLMMFALDRSDIWSKVTDLNSLKELIQSLDNYFLMALVFTLFQFLQVVLIPLPGTITTAVGSILFGPVLGGIYSYVGIVAGSITAFVIGRKFGYKLVAWILGEEDLKKAIEFMKGRDKIIFVLVLLLPAFPDDMLCFVAGLSTMSLGFFSAAIVITRIITTFCNVYALNLFIELYSNHLVLAIILTVVVIAAMTLLFYYGARYGKKIEEYLNERLKARRQRRAQKRKEKAYGAGAQAAADAVRAEEDRAEERERAVLREAEEIRREQREIARKSGK